jgi:hypothetical protein
MKLINKYSTTTGVAFKNFLLGMGAFLQCWFAAFLFNGFMIKADDIIWPLRAFVYMLPL